MTIYGWALWAVWLVFTPVNGNYRDFNEQEGLFDLRIHALVVDRLKSTLHWNKQWRYTATMLRPTQSFHS